MKAVNLSKEQKEKIISIRDSICLQEVFQVLAEIEPVYREGSYNLTELERKNLRKVIPDLGFKIRFYDEPVGEIYYMGKSMDLIERAHKARKEGNYRKLGKILGYPECCINHFLNSFHEENNRTKTLPYSCDNKLKKYDYRINNIYNPSNHTIEDKLYHYTGNFSHFKNYFISHVPCSYECEKSLELGKQTEEVLKENFPDYTKNLIQSLRRGFIILDKLEFVVISFDVEGDRIKYNVDTSSPLVDNRTLAELQDGNYIKIKDRNSITISGGREEEEFKATIILFD